MKEPASGVPAPPLAAMRRCPRSVLCISRRFTDMRDDAPNVFYTFSARHCSRIVLVRSCAAADVTNMRDGTSDEFYTFTFEQRESGLVLVRSCAAADATDGCITDAFYTFTFSPMRGRDAGADDRQRTATDRDYTFTFLFQRVLVLSCPAGGAH